MSASAKATKPVGEGGKNQGLDFASLGLNLVGLVAGVAVWWVLTASGAVGLPPPPDVARKFVDLIASGQLATDIISSLARVLTGFLLGVALAVPVGFLMGWYKVARGLIEPYVQFFRTIPPLAHHPARDRD